jgi:hypothetical protein
MNFGKKLEDFVKWLENKKTDFKVKESVLKSDLAGKENPLHAVADRLKGKPRAKQGIITRLVTQMIIFYLNFLVYCWMVNSFGFEEAVIIIFSGLASMLGYLIIQDQGGN